MIIYKVSMDYDHYKSSCRYIPIGHDEAAYDGEMIDTNGTPMADNWHPRRFTLTKSRKKLGNLANSCDCSYLILDCVSADKLKPVIGNAEFLPLKCDFGDYCCVNVIDVLDCIDYEKSEYKPLRKDEWPPRFLSVYSLAFRPEVVSGHHLFKTASDKRSCIYADDVFVDAVKRNNITGFDFIPWWGMNADQSTFSIRHEPFSFLKK